MDSSTQFIFANLFQKSFGNLVFVCSIQFWFILATLFSYKQTKKKLPSTQKIHARRFISTKIGAYKLYTQREQRLTSIHKHQTHTHIHTHTYAHMHTMSAHTHSHNTRCFLSVSLAIKAFSITRTESPHHGYIYTDTATTRSPSKASNTYLKETETLKMISQFVLAFVCERTHAHIWMPSISNDTQPNRMRHRRERARARQQMKRAHTTNKKAPIEKRKTCIFV